jgi:hypothetical protein
MDILVFLLVWIITYTILSTLPYLGFFSDIIFFALVLLLLAIYHRLGLPLNVTAADKLRFVCVLLMAEIWMILNFVRALLLWLWGLDVQRIVTVIEDVA